MGGNVAKALIALVTPLHIYFSRRLFESMDGVGTNDEMLIRICCSQKERHLHAAAFRFLQDTKHTLKAYVDDECSGNYRSLLVAVIETFCETEQAPEGFGLVCADPVVVPVENSEEKKEESAPETPAGGEPAPAAPKCALQGCNLAANERQGHGFCCRKCKNGKGHGAACTQKPV